MASWAGTERQPERTRADGTPTEWQQAANVISDFQRNVAVRQDRLQDQHGKHRRGEQFDNPHRDPIFSKNIYCADFSAVNVSAETKWMFFHEMTHVWQYYHRINVLTSAIGLAILTLGSYEKGYPYSLRPPKKFASFNIEQQASIVGDYYALTQSGSAQLNQDRNPSVVEYFDLIAELRYSGPPHTPSISDYDGIVDGRGTENRYPF